MSRVVLLLSVLSFTCLGFGCDEPRVPPEDGGRDDSPDAGNPMDDAPLPMDDAPTDDVPSDAPGTDAPGADAPIADAPGTDAGMVDPGTTPPPTVERSGTGGVLIRGVALTPSGPLTGEVLVVGNLITCVAASCAGMPMADTVTVIDAHGGIISPGLLNAHDHLSYDFIPEWVPSPPRLFASRYQWRGDSEYSDWVSAEGYMSTAAICPGSKWGELRSIIHGTTTVQGQSQAGASCTDRLARNADTYHGLYDGPDPDAAPEDFMRVTIAGPCESSFPARPGLVADFLDGDARRFVVHVGEGVRPHATPGSSSDPTREFDCFAGRTFAVGSPAAVNLLEDAAGTPYGSAVMIHAMPLTPTELDEAVMTNVRFVWSPSSNVLLYGDTAPIADMMARGLTIALAPDWTVSGSDEMLSEMRYAYDYGVTMGIPELTPRRLFEMATIDAAEVVGLESYVGTIEVGRVADLVIFSRMDPDPYRAVLDSRARDVSLTLIGGRAYYGTLPMEEIAINGDCESLDVCGSERFICVQNTPATHAASSPTGMADTMASIETELNRIMDANVLLRPMAATEVLPLVDCSL